MATINVDEEVKEKAKETKASLTPYLNFYYCR